MPSISTSSLAVCRWLSCKETFETQDRLVMHVLDEHVAKASPVKRRDVAPKLRTPDGTSSQDSIQTSLLLAQVEATFTSHENKNNMLAESHAGPSTLRNVPALQSPPRRLSASPRSEQGSFHRLTRAASRSPDPDQMVIAASPSSADIIANIINRANNRHTPADARLHQRTRLTRGGEKALSSSPRPVMRQRMRTGSAPSPKKHKIAESLIPTPLTNVLRSDDVLRTVAYSSNPADTIDPSCLHASFQSDSQTQSMSHTPPSSSKRARSESQSQVSSNRSTAARPFRTGSIHLQPSLQRALPTAALEPQSNVQSDFQTSGSPSAPGPEPAQVLKHPHSTAPFYVHDVDAPSYSSLELPLLDFSQTLDQDHSQLQLQTQAPYSIDSQVDSQSQSQLL
ncbi:hypothetical protein M0805_000285 [Coniferiporia weirii]|nr:hypothetical protein M0805_000285 [Coniferiporia weirii]